MAQRWAQALGPQRGSQLRLPLAVPRALAPRFGQAAQGSRGAGFQQSPSGGEPLPAGGRGRGLPRHRRRQALRVRCRECSR